MTHKHPTSRSERFIVEQWDRNAPIRLKELESGTDQTYATILCPVLLELLKNSSSGRTVLDVGCGLGFLSDFLRRQHFEVTGVDMSPRCISIAQNIFPELTLFAEDIVSFQHHHTIRFDAAVGNMFFHNVPDVAEVAAAIFALLKPGGVLVGCIPHPVHWFDKRRSLMTKIMLFGKPAFLAPFKIRGLAQHPAPFTYFHRDCEKYWEDLIAAGFSKVEAVSFDKTRFLPKDIVFFVAKKADSRHGAAERSKP